MGDSYRIQTEIGVNKSINIQLDQDFEFLEILSLKIQQVDLYDRNCADYGVLIGRVTANNGFGIPNARVSLFIPVSSIDESNPIIQSIYPYKSPNDINEDGYRYNLLPYEKSYSNHAATGTLPTRLDSLTGTTAIEIFDKYYKFTAKTNDSGDYMIFGLPLGYQELVMDVDLSDIGEFSLTPQDLVRMGIATESQVAGNKFKSSTDLNSLPQIVNIVKSCNIKPLWGDPEICQISVNRVDFDLRNDSNIDIQPTAIFMGAIYSSSDSLRVRPGKNSTKIKDNLGNLCELIAGPGQILAIRQTIAQDSNGNPVLEQYQLEQAGNVIDGDGAWLTELPMNLDYVTTNQFGQRIISNDPSIGIPTKGKYRFKIKWDQPKNLTEQVRRPYYLVPNVKEYGWQFGVDPNSPNTTNVTAKKQLQSSYYFGLDWSGYTDGFTGPSRYNRLNEVIDCQDTFYEFTFNKVYTVAGLIDEFKDGGRGNFIGIKEINDNSCTSTVNKFPVNEGFRNFDLIYFIFSVLMYVVNRIMVPVLIVAHYLTYLFNIIVSAFCWLFSLGCGKIDWTIRFPMMTYPTCEACDCDSSKFMQQSGVAGTNGALSFVSEPDLYVNLLRSNYETLNPDGSLDDRENWAIIASQALAGNPTVGDPNLGKLPKSYKLDHLSQGGSKKFFCYSPDLPLGERINMFNLRSNYFNGVNKIKVTYEPQTNVGVFHYDNTITVLSRIKFNAGDLLTTVNPVTTSDPNFFFSAITGEGIGTNIGPQNNIVVNNNQSQLSAVNGITGTTKITPFPGSDLGKVDVTYAETQSQNKSVSYYVPITSVVDRNIYPMDREYFQVITAITVADAAKIWDKTPSVSENSFASILLSPSIVISAIDDNSDYRKGRAYQLSPTEYYENMDQQYIIILQRGVDPYSPRYETKYELGSIFGVNMGDITVTTKCRFNIPIQKLTPNNSQQSIQLYNQTQMMYPSYFFLPGSKFSAFTTTSIGYYGKLSAFSQLIIDGQDYIGDFLYGQFTPSQVYGSNSKDINIFYSTSPSVNKYNSSEDITGGSFMAGPYSDAWIGSFEDFDWEDDLNYKYYSKVDKQIQMSISDKERNVVRTDRLPSSDSLNGLSWETNPAILQQNNNFIFYLVDGTTDLSEIILLGETTGAQQVQPNIEGQAGSVSVFDSFNCKDMVSLNCYQGIGEDFGIKQSCIDNDSVENGCYVFLRNPVRGLNTDLSALAEWSYRFRFFYGLCRGVLAESFTNNWVNGSLFMFPIQVNTFFDAQNQPFSVYPDKVIYFDKSTNNFYVRSSPVANNQFIGLTPQLGSDNVNTRNLLFPTTIIDLGMKDRFYSEIILEPYANGYIMNKLEATSYGDTSDLLNLFVISRITDENTLQQFLSLGNNAISQLFSRGPGSTLNQRRKRIDGDLAQNLSINSEVGVVKFSPEYYEVPICDEVFCLDNSCYYRLTNETDSIQQYFYYDDNGVLISGQLAIGAAPIEICANKKYGDISATGINIKLLGCCNYIQNPVQILGTGGKPVMAIWFSSSTEDLQIRDYLTPGRITFRNSSNNTFNFNYGIKSQVVPFYKWRLARTVPIFGDEQNNWATRASDILSREYQSLDRIPNSTPGAPTTPYFLSTTAPTSNSDYRRGYIFSVDSTGNYISVGAATDSFIVGAPFHFYFGIMKGKSALDIFKTKYLADE